MRSTRSAIEVSTVVVLAGAVAFSALDGGGAARAQDAPPAAAKHELLSARTFEVGDVLTTERSQTMNMRMSMSAGGNVLRERTTDETLTFTRVEEVIAIDDAGQPTHLRFHFTSWIRQLGGDAFDDLTGATIDRIGVGASRSWKALTDDAAWSPQTRQWVERKMGPDDDHDEGDEDGFARSMSPGRPVAIGEEWEPDMAPLVRVFGVSGPDGAKASARLLRVGDLDGRRTAWIEATCTVDEPRFGDLPIEWGEGDPLSIELTGSMPREPRAIAEDGTAEMTFDRSGKLNAQGRLLDVAFTVDARFTSKSRVGGTIPEIPAEDE